MKYQLRNSIEKSLKKSWLERLHDTVNNGLERKRRKDSPGRRNGSSKDNKAKIPR